MLRTRALVLLLVIIVAGLTAGPVLGVEPGEGDAERATKRVGDGAVGVSISVPKGWTLERENVTLGGTRGFTVWRPEVSPDEHDHGGTPAVRVALAYGLAPGGIEARVRDRLADYPDLPMQRQELRVGEKNTKAVAVGPIPGGTPSTEVYAAFAGRVYQINVYTEGTGKEDLDEQDKRLLSTLRFSPPSRAGAASLPDGGDPETYYEPSNSETRQESAARAEDAARSTSAERSTSGLPTYGERRIAEGCWLAPSRYYVQTQHGWHANRLRDDPGTNAPTGFTKIGQPNFWGQYTHGNLGWGRCDRKQYTNDKFAVDYPYNKGDALFPPFKAGTVVFAGRTYTHRHYGIFVVIRADGGKYVSMSAHLNALAAGIRKGKRVTNSTVIGYAGNTGHPSIPVGEVHLHQAFYRYPSFNRDGSPYGGASLKVVYHRYLGCPASANCGTPRPGGIYQFVGRDTRQTSSRQMTEGDFISN